MNIIINNNNKNTWQVLCQNQMQNYWKCDNCYCHVTLDDDKCLACENPRPPAVDNGRGGLQNNNNNNTWEVLCQNQKQNYWKCDNCYCHVMLDDDKCLACQNPRPPAVDGREGQRNNNNNEVNNVNNNDNGGNMIAAAVAAAALPSPRKRKGKRKGRPGRSVDRNEEEETTNDHHHRLCFSFRLEREPPPPPPAVVVKKQLTDMQRFYYFVCATRDMNNDTSMLAVTEIKRIICDFACPPSLFRSWARTVADKWKCPTCSVYNNNDDNIQNCVSCETQRPLPPRTVMELTNG